MKKRRVAGYARVSTDSLEQATSYEAQVDYYTTMIKGREDWEYVDVYTDDGISATTTRKREGFNRMVADALAGKIDLIVTKSVSRFARNTVDSLTTVRQLKEKGVEIFFEKENIWTLDSKGELLITIMSSLAQEESRSISENCTWGQRKRFADGKVSVPFKRFLGYDRGVDGNLVVNPEQAKIVKMIYGSFLKGKSPRAIGKELTEKGIPTPGGKTIWSERTVRGILTNEKYKGDALLQKTYTVDFLTKATKVNEGEIPQYYVKGNHEAIIEPEVFDLVQNQMALRRPGKNRLSCVNIFSTKIRCMDCGSWYSPKTWHSNDKYRKTVWQCLYKYKNEKRCKTPHFVENEIKEMFIKAANQVLSNKDEIIDNFNDIKDIVFSTEKLESEETHLEEEVNELAGLIEDCINENARKAIDQIEYEKSYSALIEKYDKAMMKYNNVKKEIQLKTAKRQRVQLYLNQIEHQDILTEFDEDVWISMVDYLEVSRDGTVEFFFKDGMNIKL